MKARQEKKPTTGNDGRSDVVVANNASLSSITNSNSSRNGINNASKMTRDQIVTAINEKIFPYMKFITSEDDMQPGFAPFGGKIMNEMNVQESNKLVWWHAYKGIAKHALQQKRSSVGATVKKSVMCKCRKLATLLIFT